MFQRTAAHCNMLPRVERGTDDAGAQPFRGFSEVLDRHELGTDPARVAPLKTIVDDARVTVHGVQESSRFRGFRDHNCRVVRVVAVVFDLRDAEELHFVSPLCLVGIISIHLVEANVQRKERFLCFKEPLH